MGDPEDMQLPSLKALQTGEQMELLNIVDSLRAEGLGEITALPQLIVCGDQSSGKSSVLEAISGIPFPRKENTCTRFATEVILRRSPESRISVSIVPSRDRKQADREKLLEFRHQLSKPDDFPDLFDKAKDAMLNVPGESFSKDILRIEFCGPSQPQLTLVDLPGLIHSHIETEKQKSGDIKLVTELVSDYLKSPRSIILAIVSAKYDINVQAILNRAREVDPQGIRTLGIITKPDTLVRGSESEDSFVKLARNERVRFRLGWHVVKNLDSAHKESLKSTLETRNAEEKAYFKESNFKSLPSHNVGIESLRSQLSKVLFNQIRLELPRLVDDIEQRILTARAAKDKLGPNRTTIDDQRAFLIQLSQTFQTICQAAVRGDYDNEFFQTDDLSEKRLCANVMNKHFEFAENLRKSGSQWTIVEKKVDSIFNKQNRTREEAIVDACRLLKRSRGRELPGLPNPLLVGELFREYSRPWEVHARMHIKNTWEITNRFLGLVLQHLTDDDVCEKLLRLWLNPIMAQKLEAAYDKLDELLDVHKEHPLTTNHYFMDNRKKFQQKDTKDEMQRKLKSVTKPGQMMSVDDVALLVMTLNSDVGVDMDMLAAEDAYDNMMAYYKVAMKLFMDNVPTLAIQAPIIRKLDEVLCPTTVFRMPPELVTKIAGESDEKMQEREEVLSKLNTLEAGAQICRQYAMRPQFSATAPLNPPFGGSAFPPGSSSGTNLFGDIALSKGIFGNAAPGNIPSSSSGTNPSGSIFGQPTSSQTSQTSRRQNPPRKTTFPLGRLLQRTLRRAEKEIKSTPWQLSLSERSAMGIFDVHREQESGHPPCTALYRHISAMPKYENYSVEELRLSDIALANS
ncbi:hypothetical protein O988_08880 [Pseudogymnoascus sp. VKM F-3808]|nr:hypothetical protein O988_08880 [Pseudogymnoascus sp. VKM F-3808]